MSELVTWAEAEFETNYAIVGAWQSRQSVDAASFAGTCPGAVASLGGASWARIRLRAERWDGRPPHQPGWEDVDELPFAEVPGSPLMLGGFDPSGTTLDIDGIGPARVRVQARGRHRYGYSSLAPTLPPEEWLFQFWPQPGPPDPLGGEPRRLAGPGPLDARRRSGWQAALHAWVQTGWSGHLRHLPWFGHVERALTRADGPIDLDQLARGAHLCHDWRLKDPSQVVAPLDESLLQPLDLTTAPEHLVGLRQADHEQARARLDRFADVTGVRPLATLGDLLSALQRVGLLLTTTRRGRDLLVPNPAPGFVWDEIDMDDESRRQRQVDAGRADFARLGQDIDNVLWWAPENRLSVTARAIAVRLAVPPEDVLGALDWLQLQRRVRYRPVGAPEDPDADPEAVELLIDRPPRD